MSDTKILVLCNNRLAVPAIQELHFFGHLSAVIIPAINKDVIASVEEILQQHPVPLIKVNKKNFEAETLRYIRENNPQAGMVMTFPYKLSEEVFTAMPRGFYNFHYGPLPQYRGPEPIFAQLKNGESRAGLNVHLIDELIDGGPIVMEEKIIIEPADTYGMVQTKLSYLGAKLAGLLIRTLEYSSFVPSRRQDEAKASYYHRPTLKDVFINWKEMNSSEILSLVKACNPWNKGAGTRIKNFTISLLEVEITEKEITENITPGTIVCLNSTGLFISTKDGRLIKASIFYCPEGFMSGEKLMNFGIKVGDCFE